MDAGVPEERREPRGLTKVLAVLGEGVRARMGPAAPALPTITFGIAWLYLNAFVGSTWPVGQSAFPAYLLPSVEVTVVLAIVCVIAWLGARPRGGIYFVAAALLLSLRLLRTADSLALEYLDRRFQPYLDLGLVWELFILLDDTIDRLTLIGYMAVSALVLGGLVFLAKQALLVAHGYFTERTHRLGFLGLVGVLILLGLATSGAPFQEAPTARAITELGRDAGDRVDAKTAEVTDALRRMGAAPHGLEGLGERDVYLFHLGSYGRVLLEQPDYRSRMQPVWTAVGEALADDGYAMRCSLLEAPARRGLPWLSHLTLATGVRAESELDFEAVLAAEPATLASRLQDAGYRTVRVLPGETRERPERELPGYGMQYRAWELGYLGPAYGRIPMPDQFAIARVHEREVDGSDLPVFVEHVMSAVRPPYASVPPLADDWESLGSGSGAVFRDLEPRQFEGEWSTLDRAAPGWLAALEYELTVVQRFLVDYLPDPQPRRRRRRGQRAEPLVILVGDHQPPGPLARDAPTDAVLVHVVARDEELLAPFAGRGWQEGLVPTKAPPYDGMETFLPRFLEDFSASPE